MHTDLQLLDLCGSKLKVYLGLLSILITIYILFKQLYLVYRRQRIIRDNGCKTPRDLFITHRWGLGIDKLQEAASHVKEKSYLELTAARFANVSSHTYTSSVLGSRMIDTCEPKNIQTILAHGFEDWSLGEGRKHAFSKLLGHGILNTDGPQWKASRTALRPSFTGENLSRLDTYEKFVQQLLQIVEDLQYQAVDLSELFFCLTLDSATEVFFGQSCHSLQDLSQKLSSEQIDKSNHETASQLGPTSSSAFGLAFDRCQRVMADNLVLGRLGPLVTSSATRKQFDEDCSVCLEFVGNIVDNALNHTESQSSSSPSDNDARTCFLTDMVGKGYDPETLKYELVTLVMAGRDTTASLLSNLWFILARSPKIYEKLRNEIAQSLGSDPTRVPELSDLNEMSYLRACINEALRLYPPVPINSRTAIRDTVLPCGGGEDGQQPIFIPSGTRVGYNIWAMHRREDIWGPDAAHFRPERWLEPRDPSKRRGWEFLPFSGGPRICLGQRVALNQARFVTCRLVQHFSNIQAEPGNEYNRHLLEASQLKLDPLSEGANTFRRKWRSRKSSSSSSSSPRELGEACALKWKENLTLTCTSADGAWVSLMP